MVFKGQPSKACLECRKRRLRCDLHPGSCGQCRRGHRPCTGYRDVSELQILDQTQLTRKRVLMQKVRAHPTLPLDQIARNVFFYYYVSGVSNTYDALDRLFRAPDAHLVASVDAVSLAYASSQFRLRGAQQLARRKYLTALSLLNKTLLSPVSARKDSTLLAVLLLDLFEKIVNSENDAETAAASAAWMSHVHGALSLVELRTQDQLQTYIGTRLTIRLCINLVISCAVANAAVPPTLKRIIRDRLEPHIAANDPKWRVTAIVAKIADLRASSDMLSTLEIRNRAAELGAQLCGMADQMPSSSTYSITRVAFPNNNITATTTATTIRPLPNHFHTQLWNVIRLWRIIVNALILSTYEERDQHDRNLLTHAIDTQALEILSSVPVVFPSASTASSSLPSSSASPSPSAPSPLLQKRKAYTLLFPLYVAAYHASTKSGIRARVVAELRSIADGLGVMKAGVLAGLLAANGGCTPERRGGGEGEKRLPRPFEVYAMLGAYGLVA